MALTDKFYDRKEELASLQEKYGLIDKYGKGTMLAVYGRRRVGKTELIRKFLEDKERTLYFYVDLAEKNVLLDALSKAVQEQLKETIVFGNFNEFFDYIAKKTSDTTFVLAIDEFQRFLDVAPEFITSLQKNWDTTLKNRRIMIIVVGSSIGMMQKITSSRAGALYGRAARTKISPFKYKDMREMFSELAEEEKVIRYAAFGGTPYYLEKTKRYQDTYTAINDLILKKDGELSEEPRVLMEYENVRVHAKYNSILQSISEGKEVFKEIQDYTKIESNTLPPYLIKLDQLLDLIERNDPVLGKERLGRYKIKDNFFRFWYKFIARNQTPLILGNTQYVADIIKNELNAYTGRIFEDVIKELLIAYQGQEIQGHKINFETIGGWWDRNGNEIDMAAHNPKEKTLLLGEVKWTNQQMDIDLLDELIRKGKLIGASGRYDYMIVSKSGFTDKCLQRMDEEKVIHLDLKDVGELYDLTENPAAK